jgi:hypothetical protein
VRFFSSYGNAQWSLDWPALLAYCVRMTRRKTTHEDMCAVIARGDMARLLDELRARPELNDLDDEQSMALALSETRAVKQVRGAMGLGRTDEAELLRPSAHRPPS